jgi:IPT/TIG domain
MKTPIPKSISRSYRLKLIGMTFTGALMLGIPVLHSWGKSPSSEDFNLNISRSGNDLVLSWTVSDVVLQRSQTLNGDWLDVPDASSPHTVTGNFDKSFFRLKKVSTVHAVEPAFLPTSGGTIYVRGVNFDSNSTVTLNGMPAASVVFVDPSL